MTPSMGIDTCFLATRQMPYDTLAQAEAEYYGRLLAQQDSAASFGRALDGQGTLSSDIPITATPRVTEEKGNGVGLAVTLGVAVIGATALILGHSKGKEVLKGLGEAEQGWLKTSWTGIKSWFKKSGTKAVSEAAESATVSGTSTAGSAAGRAAGRTRNGHAVSVLPTERVQSLVNGAHEYTIVKDGVTITMKGDQAVKIVTQANEVITDTSAINKLLHSNGSRIQATINKLNITDKLDDNVRFIFERKVPTKKGYKIYTVENGQIKKVQIFKNGKSDAVQNLEGNALQQYLKALKDPSEIKEVTKATKKVTLDRNIAGVANSGDEIIIESSHGGKILSAKLENGTEFTSEQLASLRKNYGQEFQKKWQNEALDPSLNTFEKSYYEYRPTHGERYRFEVNNNVRTINYIEKMGQSKELSTTQDINNYFNKHNNLKEIIGNIKETGELPHGFRFGDITVKTDNDIVCKISNNGHKLESVTLKEDFTTAGGATYGVGATINGDALKEWLKVAENEAEVKKVLEMLK